MNGEEKSLAIRFPSQPDPPKQSRGTKSGITRYEPMILLAAAALTALNPLSFFTGPTHGVGTIKIMFKSAQRIHVTSRVHPDGNGGIYLDQDVTQGSEPSEARH